MTTALQAPPPLKHETLTAMQTIITTVDRHAREHNLRWGFNRLPHLVPIAETERFVRARHKWNIACFECAGSLNPDDLDRVRKQGEALMRGFDHLARLAIEAGHDPLPATTWEFELEDGTPVILVRDRAELSQVDTGGRTAQVWSLDEIATILAKFPMMARAKECFPGSEVIQMRTDPLVIGKLDDELSDLPGFG